ncbi:zinc-ribbon domain-containing protein [Kitasatospora sp. NPDC088783]|uniref:zinc-ribbon domain-containing protein n=1 Tax=Kitasatospora sp. NPDC088783 TaxID=3364077 RepID=UPI003830C088
MRTGPARTPYAPGEKQRALLKDSGLSLLDWWDHEVNSVALWETTIVTARREVAWRCPDCGLRFAARVNDMMISRQCSACEPLRRAEQEAEDERLRVTPVSDALESMAAWADDEDPHAVFVTVGGPPRRFRCRQGHEDSANPRTYLRVGCFVCFDQKLPVLLPQADGTEPAPFRLSPEIAAQWHPTLNGRTSLAKISPGSRRTVWWREPACGHEWQDTPAQRQRGQRLRCPMCRTILDSLVFHFPTLAAEWSPANPVSAWHVRPTGQTSFVPTWVCSADSGHLWQAALTSRANDTGCPECREHGKSQVELDHHAAAQRAFGAAASGRTVRHGAFVGRSSWTVDIAVDLPDDRKLAIEYDGSYWHADKKSIDTEKSHDLLAAGYLVVRLREHPLPALPIDDLNYTEFTVRSASPRPDDILGQVKQWVAVTKG